MKWSVKPPLLRGPHRHAPGRWRPTIGSSRSARLPFRLLSFVTPRLLPQQIAPATPAQVALTAQWLAPLGDALGFHLIPEAGT